MPLGNVTLPISSAGYSHIASGYTIPVLRLWVDLMLPRQAGPLLLRPCLLDTGAPLCVVPYAVHTQFGLAWQPLPGPWPKGFTTWSGIPRTVGLMAAWLTQPQPPFVRGPLAFIAKFVQATPTQAIGNIPVLLGLNFLADHGAEVAFQCHTRPQAGSVQFP
jgi:hypothetical protein